MKFIMNGKPEITKGLGSLTPKPSQTINEPESTDSIGRVLQSAQDELAEAGSLFRKNTKECCLAKLNFLTNFNECKKTTIKGYYLGTASPGRPRHARLRFLLLPKRAFGCRFCLPLCVSNPPYGPMVRHRGFRSAI